MARAGNPLSKDVVDELIRRRVAGEAVLDTCRDLGLSTSTYMKYVKAGGMPERLRGASPKGCNRPRVKVGTEKVGQKVGDPAEIKPKRRDDGVVSFRSKGDEASGEYVVDQQPTEQTLVGLLAECGADLTTWSVKEWSYRAWTTGLKIKDGDTDRIAHSKQYSISVAFKRVAPKPISDAADVLWSRFREAAPKFPPRRYTKKSDPLLGVVCLMDAHIGRLSWGREVGGDWDLSIAERVWRNAVDDLIARSEGQRVEKWIIPIGNDMAHVDGHSMATHGGTPQDCDGRYSKIFEVCCRAGQYAIERFSEVAESDVILIPGNHDTSASFHIASYLSAYFRNNRGVSVDCSPTMRKYRLWRNVLTGYTHGCDEKVADLPSIMAMETKKTGWSTAEVVDMYLGHVHSSQKFMTKGTTESKGVTIRTMRSIAQGDAWHVKKGYIGALRAAEAHFYGPSHWDSCISVLARGGG